MAAPGERRGGSSARDRPDGAANSSAAVSDHAALAVSGSAGSVCSRRAQVWTSSVRAMSSRRHRSSGGSAGRQRCRCALPGT
ncbi:hypothetical protein HCN51_26240 [Nonomuraea sp. FMUSA5-5]|uniref:Uncharacterized protein n=1 Tax=Nonomuraea composti TaxID=2720023 RepID=A0ABX1BAU9_9ACTN|nr:hypothetical protein [Nonomuraea sp. FMUSA5-5]NJP92911.1 hypothetical protein [Nonomuraea sp. FMUSA5-5]